jgi:hypothetical protein
LSNLKQAATPGQRLVLESETKESDNELLADYTLHGKHLTFFFSLSRSSDLPSVSVHLLRQGVTMR